MRTLPKIEWLGTAEDAHRCREREELEADIDLLERTFTPLTQQELKKKLKDVESSL